MIPRETLASHGTMRVVSNFNRRGLRSTFEREVTLDRRALSERNTWNHIESDATNASRRCAAHLERIEEALSLARARARERETESLAGYNVPR